MKKVVKNRFLYDLMYLCHTNLRLKTVQIIKRKLEKFKLFYMGFVQIFCTQFWEQIRIKL